MRLTPVNPLSIENQERQWVEMKLKILGYVLNCKIKFLDAKNVRVR